MFLKLFTVGIELLGLLLTYYKSYLLWQDILIHSRVAYCLGQKSEKYFRNLEILDWCRILFHVLTQKRQDMLRTLKNKTGIDLLNYGTPFKWHQVFWSCPIFTFQISTAANDFSGVPLLSCSYFFLLQTEANKMILLAYCTFYWASCRKDILQSHGEVLR